MTLLMICAGGAALFSSGVVILTIYAHWKRGVFRKMGVPCAPTIPFFGNLHTYGEMCMFEVDTMHLNKYGANDGKIVGVFEGREPVLLIADADMIRNVMQVQSSQFYNIDGGDFTGSILELSLIAKQGPDWKRIRQALTPTFTPANLRKMAILVSECSNYMLDDLISKHKEGPVDVVELSRTFTIRAISSLAFGVDLKKSGPEQEKLFLQAAIDILATPNPLFLSLVAIFRKPVLHAARLFQFFGIKPSGIQAMEMFEKIVRTEIDRRVRGKARREDFLQSLLAIEVPKIDSNNSGLTRDEVVAQVVTFLLAGYDTVASTLAYFMVAMAQNPDCQARLREELAEAQLGSEADNLTEKLASLPYLDMCMRETLRIYPAASRTNRICTATEGTTIGGIHIPCGLNVGIPIATLHQLPEFWPEPEKFDPQRFSEGVPREAAFAYLPFGSGHRNCIGERMAKMELRTAIAAIFRNYQVELTADTKFPVELETTGLRTPKHPILLKFIESPI